MQIEPRVIVLFAFVFITLLTAIAVLAAAIGWLPNANAQLVSWGLPTVIGEIILTVVMYFKSQWSNQITINLAFEGSDAFNVDFATTSCTYTVIDSSGKEVKTGNIVPILGHGGWQIQLPVAASSENSISLSLGNTDW
jgi:hypothetical protein